MTPPPASEILAVVATVSAAISGWLTGKIVALTTIEKDDLLGPLGALVLAVGGGALAIRYFVKRQARYDAREERREERREQQLVHIAEIAQASNRAVETSNEIGAEMKTAVKEFREAMSQQTKALNEMQETISKCPGRNL
jgi:uncharacterized protein HemX